MAFVYHIELTNVCDLDCGYCPLTYSDRSKGLMSEATFRKIVEHMRHCSPLNFMILHHFGEPLLHPHLARFVRIANEARLNPGFSTNAERLTREKLAELIANGLRWMCVTFHTPAGERTYHALRDLAIEHELVYWGRQLVSEPASHDPRAVHDYGIERQLLHTFAGSVGPEVPQRPGWVPRCDYLERNFVCILHDGRVVPCAMDERAESVLGTVDELDSIIQRESYELCRTCQGFRFFDPLRALARDLVDEGRILVGGGWSEPAR